MEDFSDKTFILKKHPVILVHGKRNVGKTTFVKKLIESSDYIYFQFFENTNSIDIISNVLNIKTTGTNISLDAIILQKLDRLMNIENKTVIFDNIEKMDREGLSLFFNLSMKGLHNMSKGHIIAIYTDSNMKQYLKGMLSLLVNQGAFDLKMKKPSYEEFKEFIKVNGYSIHENLLKMIYKEVNGNYNFAQDVLIELEKKGYIVEKTFIRNVDETKLDEIRNLILEISSKEFKIPNLDEDDKILLFILNNVNKIKINELNKIFELKNVEKSLIKLLKYKLILIDGQEIYIKKKIYITLRNSNLIYSNIAKWYEAKKIYDEAGRFYYLSGDLKKAIKYICDVKYLRDHIYYAKYCNNKSLKSSVVDLLLKYFEVNEMFDEMYILCKNLYIKNTSNLKYVSSFAKASYLMNDYKTSKNLYKKILRISKRSSYKLNSLINLAKIYYKEEDYNKALDLILQALKIAIKKEDKINEAEIYKIIGNIYYYNFNDTSAKAYYDRSLEIYNKLNIEKEKANIYNNLGNIFLESDLIKSMDYYSKAMELSEKYWWISLIIALNINLGIISIFTGNIANAIYNERRSVGLALAKKDYSSAILAINYIFEIQMLKGDYDGAEETINLGLKLSKKSLGKITNKTLKMDKTILNIIKGQLKNTEIKVEIFRNDIPIQSELTKYYASQLKFYSTDINGYIEEFRKNFLKETNMIKIGDLLDLMNYLEIVLYRDYFNRINTKEIIEVVEKVKNIKDIEKLKLIKWRINVIDSIFLLDTKNTRNMFYENIKKIENEGLKYLSAKLKIIYGLYYYNKMKDNSILKEGINVIKSFNRSGLLVIYSNAIRMI